MTRYALIAALVALLGLSGWMAYQSREMGTIRADNAALARSNASLLVGRENARLALEVAAARSLRQQELNRRASEKLELLQKLTVGECADTPLDPAWQDLFNGD